MQTQLKQEVIRQIFEIVDSKPFAQRLAVIHKHYPNLKAEGRYRDALLELFNEAQEKSASALWAYAEADKIDMVVTQDGAGEEGWLRIEFKYHFTYDMSSRVKAALGSFSNLPKNGTFVDALKAQAKGDLRGIALDCLAPKGNAASCDLFILVVQDRTGAFDPAAPQAQPPASKKQTFPTVFKRGVPIHFLHEQIKLDHAHRGDAAAYRDAWTKPLHAMLGEIHGRRPFRLIPAVSHTMPKVHEGVPLSSHIIGLDFSIEAAQFPADSRALFR